MKIYSFVMGYEYDGELIHSYHKTKEGATKAMFKYVQEFHPDAVKSVNKLGNTIFKYWDSTYYVEEIEVNDD